MRLKRGLLIMAAVCVGSLALSACGSIDKIDTSAPYERQGPQTAAPGGEPVLAQLKDKVSLINPFIYVAIGKCDDETGKYLDSGNGMTGYSKAVTQGGAALLGHYAKMAGLRMPERDPYNLGMIAQEHNLAMHLVHSDPKDPKSPMVLSGLIQDDVLNHGLMGANYMLTCAITSYSPATTSGGGGADVDAMGVSVANSAADVSVVIKIVDMQSGLTVDSVLLDTMVEGSSVDFHFTRFLGDMATTAATVLSSGGTSTILSPNSNAHVVSGEVGGAVQLPIDWALQDVLKVGLAQLLERNKGIFYLPKADIHFNYDAPAGN